MKALDEYFNGGTHIVAEFSHHIDEYKVKEATLACVQCGLEWRCEKVDFLGIIFYNRPN